MPMLSACTISAAAPACAAASVTISADALMGHAHIAMGADTTILVEIVVE